MYSLVTTMRHFFSPPLVFQVARSNKHPSFSFPPFYIYAGGRKYGQNLSVARARGGTNSPMTNSPTPGSCIHRRHMRLESLRTLILADNKLTRLSLYLDENDFSLVTEVDENEVSDSGRSCCCCALPVCIVELCASF